MFIYHLKSGIDLINNCCDSGASIESKLFLNTVDKCFLTQHVKCLTTDKSVLDLIISNDSDLVYNVQVLGNFEKSDHKLLCCNLNIAKKEEDSIEVRYDYSKLDVVGASEELSLIDWEEELKGTVNESWESLKDILFRIQSKYVPRKAKGGKKKLWMTYKALKCVKQKHKVFQKYKDTKHPACRRAANKASMELKKVVECWLDRNCPS